MVGCVRPRGPDVLLDVRVSPNSRSPGLFYDPRADRALVRVREPARDGKANRAVLGVLERAFGDCVLISGRASRNKTLLIKNKGKEEIEKILEEKRQSG